MAQKKAIILLLLFCSLPARAVIKNFGPVSIDLPFGWECTTESQNLICLDESENSEKNAALVVSYKIRGGEDSLAVYRTQLANPRNLNTDGKVTPSQPKGVKDMSINSALWVEGIHLSSEIADYYTHYYATVTANYAVLVSISIQQDAYKSMLRKIMPSIYSLQLQPQQTKDDIYSAGPKSLGTVNSNNIRSNTDTMTHTPDEFDSGNISNTTHRRPRAMFSFFGISVPRGYVYLGGALLVVLGMLGYAIKM